MDFLWCLWGRGGSPLNCQICSHSFDLSRECSKFRSYFDVVPMPAHFFWEALLMSFLSRPSWIDMSRKVVLTGVNNDNHCLPTNYISQSKLIKAGIPLWIQMRERWTPNVWAVWRKNLSIRNSSYGKKTSWCSGGYFLFQNVTVEYSLMSCLVSLLSFADTEAFRQVLTWHVSDELKMDPRHFRHAELCIENWTVWTHDLYAQSVRFNKLVHRHSIFLRQQCKTHGHFNILSRASEMGSPTNHPGLQAATNTGSGILWSIHRWTRPTSKIF